MTSHALFGIARRRARYADAATALSLGESIE